MRLLFYAVGRCTRLISQTLVKMKTKPTSLPLLVIVPRSRLTKLLKLLQDENARAADLWIYNDLATAYAEARRTNKLAGLQKGDSIIGMEANPLRISSSISTCT